ncbi:hypothetical protein ACJJTC_000347 [Scirpophaga incertulas]
MEKVRKARDRKIVIGCKNEEERKKVKERIEKSGDQLVVEEIKNKNPLLTLWGVLTHNIEDGIEVAIKKQNQKVFEGLSDSENNIEIKYCRRTRNPFANHVTISVAPKVEQTLRSLRSRKPRKCSYHPHTNDSGMECHTQLRP